MIIITSLVLGIFLAGALFSIWYQKKRLNEDLRTSAFSFAKTSTVSIYNLYSDTVGESIHKFYHMFKRRFNEIMDTNPDLIRVVIAGRNGKVILDSLNLKKGKPQSLFCPQQNITNPKMLKLVQKGKITTRIRINDTVDSLFLSSLYSAPPKKILGKTLEVVAPKKEVAGEHLVSLIYWFGYHRIEKEIHRSVWTISVVALAGTLLAILIAYLLSRIVADPLKKLTYSVREIEKGHLDIRVPVKTHDEIGELAKGFNSMARFLKISFEENEEQRDYLRELNAELEQERQLLEERVRARTRELKEANNKLQEMDQAKTHFFANLSHEFRNPLTFLLGTVELIMDEEYGKAIPYDSEIFVSLFENMQRLNNLVNDLLDLTKIEAGKMELNKEEFSMNQIFRAWVSSVKIPARKKNIILEYREPAEEIMASIDLGFIEKAFFNLISNALKFTPEGGKISVALDREGEFFTLAVGDTGIGIEESQLALVFNRFHQLQNPQYASHKGTGIGLSFTKEIVEMHGGKITLRSKPGEGSVFTIYLPLTSFAG
jgi:signal transduction histidine kinase